MGANPDSDARREQFSLWAGVLILTVWAIGVLVQIAWPTHVLPASVHLLAGCAATFFFGNAARLAIRGMKNGNGP